MKIKYLIFAIAPALLAGSLEDFSSAWNTRNFFFAEITQTSISPIDTTVVSGKIILRKPNAIFETSAELMLFRDGVLYTYTEGSDVGSASEVKDFALSDIGGLIESLSRDFSIEFSERAGGYFLKGMGGQGNIASFSAEMDKEFIPKLIIWTDAFGYVTKIGFKKISLKDNNMKIEPPKDIEFMR